MKKKDNKCFQCTALEALNHDEVKKGQQRMKKTKHKLNKR